MIAFIAVLCLFSSIVLMSIFNPLLLVPLMFGLIVFVVVLYCLEWYVGYKLDQKYKRLYEEELTHKYDPPIDPMFGKR